jgi:hypothetical protein
MSKLVLSEGQVTADSPISVQLIKNHHPGARPVVVITWPRHVTECSPAQLAEVVNNACRILSNGSTELVASIRTCRAATVPYQRHSENQEPAGAHGETTSGARRP